MKPASWLQNQVARFDDGGHFAQVTRPREAIEVRRVGCVPTRLVKIVSFARIEHRRLVGGIELQPLAADHLKQKAGVRVAVDTAGRFMGRDRAEPKLGNGQFGFVKE